jgi:hypothetical protein
LHKVDLRDLGLHLGAACRSAAQQRCGKQPFRKLAAYFRVAVKSFNRRLNHYFRYFCQCSSSARAVFTEFEQNVGKRLTEKYRISFAESTVHVREQGTDRAINSLIIEMA